MMENTNKLTILTLFVTLLFVGCKKKGENIYIYKMLCEEDSVFMVLKKTQSLTIKLTTTHYL